MSENSYLGDFSAKLSQIVFLAYLTALPLITTVWIELSENSNLCDISAQVWQLVFLAYFNGLRLYDLKCQKTHISAISVHKYHQSFS